MRFTLALPFLAALAACTSETLPPDSTPLPDTSSTEGSGAAGPAGSGGSGGAATTSGGGGVVSLPHCEATDPRAVPVTVWAEPDAGEAPFVDSLNKATKSIRVMVYMMGYGGILDALKAKAQGGVKVEVILDVEKQSTNQKYFNQLTSAGAEVRWSDPKFTFMHAKVFVVDDAEAVISTGNYLVSNLLKERNFVAKDSDPDDVATLSALFDADWVKSEPDLSCTRILVSPVNARQRLLDLIASAETSLVVESMQFGDTDIRDAVAARHAAGVDVRVLLADPSWIDANAEAAVFLAQKGIPTRRLASPPLHVKAFVVDGARAYMGSENFSYTSLSKNREVGIVVTEQDGVKTIGATFETDWAVAVPFAN